MQVIRNTKGAKSHRVSRKLRQWAVLAERKQKRRLEGDGDDMEDEKYEDVMSVAQPWCELSAETPGRVTPQWWVGKSFS